jgi:cytochrome b subunit of formate dehydrogenase
MIGSGRAGVRDGAGEKAVVVAAEVMEVVVAVTGSVILLGCMMGSMRLLRVPAVARCLQLLQGLA